MENCYGHVYKVTCTVNEIMMIEHPPKLYYNTKRFTFEQEQVLNNRCLGLRVLVIKTGCGWGSIPENQLIATIIDYNFAHGIYYVEFDHPNLLIEDYRYFYSYRWGQLLVLKDQSPNPERKHSFPLIGWDKRHLHKLGLLFKEFNLK